MGTLKGWLKAFASLLILALIGVAFIPSLFGSRFIYQPLLQRFKAGDFRFSAESVKLGWFSSVVVKGIDLSETNGRHLLRIEEIRNDRGLLSSFLHGRDLGTFTIVAPELDIELLTEGSNLERLVSTLRGAVDEKSKPKQVSAPPEINIDVQIVGASVRVAKKKELDAPEVLVVIPPFDVKIAYRALQEDAELQIAPTKLLDKVEITPELMRLGLDKAIPVLAKSTWFKGKISIETGDIRIPLESPPDISASGIIELHDVTSGPSDPAIVGILDLVTQLRGSRVPHELVFMDDAKITVEVSNRQVSHQGLRFGLPKVDPRLQFASQGKVGIVDRSLDLKLDVPIPLEQLARRDNVKALGVPSMELPIRGTLDKPQVDWTSMRGEGADIIGMIRKQVAEDSPGVGAALGALEGLAGGEADQAITATVELLRRLREARQAGREGSKIPNSEDGPNAEPDILPDGAESKSPPEKSNRPILDALRGILK